MPTSTANYGLQKPIVNSAIDQDLWGGELNSDLDSIDTLLRSGIATTVQTVQTSSFSASASISVKYLYPCDATSGAVVVTLPAAATAGNGAVVYIKKTDASANLVTPTRSGSDTIDGATTYNIAGQYQVVAFVSNGVSAWYVLEDGQITLSDATTTVKGITTLATTAQLITGTDTTHAVTVTAILNAIGFSSYFASAPQIITIGGALTIAHGLPRTPIKHEVVLVCQTGEFGYTTGDILFWNSMHPIGATTAGEGVSVRVNSTNILIRYGNDVPFYALRGDNGAAVSLTSANWKIIFRVWA